MNEGRAIKRALDCGIAATGLLLGAPVLAVIAAAIKLESGSPVLFAQDRIGRGGRVFRLLKFRTMREAPIRYNEDGSTRIDPNDDRVTRIGRLLRGGLDELPQLFNVLRGEMSIVGPRPEMASQRGMYSPEHLRKLDMLPGLTSLAIVQGRNEVPWHRRVVLDVWYVEKWSLSLDLRIMAQTLLMPLGLRPFDFTDVIEERELV